MAPSVCLAREQAGDHPPTPQPFQSQWVLHPHCVSTRMHSNVPLPSAQGCCQGLPGAGGPGVWSRKGQTGLAPRLGQTEPRDPVWLCEGLRPRNRWLSSWWVWTADTSRGACLGRHKPPSFWGHVKNRQDVLNQTTCLAKRVCFLPQLSPRWGP